MSQHRRLVSFMAGTLVVILACTFAPVSNPGVQSTTKPLAATDNIPPTNEPLAEIDHFPLTPDPVTVSATLDTEHAASNESQAMLGNRFNFSVDGLTADGVSFSLSMEEGLLSLDQEEELVPAFGTPITVTPISAIDGLPFSQGYLAAVYIGPQGLMQVEPASLMLILPGVYDVSSLIGFAADGSGEDFHLFPMVAFADTFNENTTVVFSVMHFSLYGVAQVTEQEISAQLAHPPVNPASQDAEELAPLVREAGVVDEDLAPLLTPKQEILRTALNRSYRRLIKPNLSRVDYIPCKQVAQTVYSFNTWVGQVNAAGLGSVFTEEIKMAASSLLKAMRSCIKIPCETCMGMSPETANKYEAARMIVYAEEAQSLARLLGLQDESIYWRHLGEECNDQVGWPPLSIHVGDVPGIVSTPIPVTCP